MCDQQSLRSACAYAQSDQSLCLSLEYSMIVKLLTEHHLEFLSLKWGCRGSSDCTLVKMCNCWKSHGAAQIICKVHVFLTYFSIHFSSGILVLVTFERTLCVISPHKVKLIFKRRNSLIWVAVLGIALFLIHGHTFYGTNILNIGEDGEILLVCEPDGSPDYLDFIDDVWIWIDLCLSFLIPCVFIFTGNILILVQLARRARQHKALGVAQQKKPSLTLLLHLLSIVFLVSTAPYNILIIILNYLDENAADPSEVYDRFFYYQDILTVVVALNPTLNFMLYFLSGSKFRKEVKALVCCETTRSGSVFWDKQTEW